LTQLYKLGWKSFHYDDTKRVWSKCLLQVRKRDLSCSILASDACLTIYRQGMLPASRLSKLIITGDLVSGTTIFNQKITVNTTFISNTNRIKEEKVLCVKFGFSLAVSYLSISGRSLGHPRDSRNGACRETRGSASTSKTHTPMRAQTTKQRLPHS
jgi:hypothetical protein